MGKSAAMTRQRHPRSSLPATFIEAEEAEIEEAVRAWRTRYEWHATSEASHRAFEAFFFDRLQNHSKTLDAASIVDVARRGHPAADRALRHYIQLAIEHRRFHELPTSVWDYAREVVARSPLAVGYSSKAPQTGNHFARDVGISLWVNRVKTQWPAVPLLYSSKARRSAVALVGTACGLSEAHTRRIFQTRGEMTLRLAEFFHGYTNTLTNEPASFVG